MTRRWAHALCAVAALSLAACEGDDITNYAPAGTESFQRYAAIGTSISQGVQSADNSLIYYNQVNAWPALLARQAGAPFSMPLMRAPGCFPHFVAPLALGRNIRGVSIGTTDTTCAGLLPGVSAPSTSNIFNNLAISGARTSYALSMTPELAASNQSTTDMSAVFRRKMYPLVLPPNHTQVTAAMALDPTFVSVELGANDVLGTLGGIVAPGVSYVPFAAWQADYDKIVDSLETLGDDLRVLLVTVPNVANIVSLRTGAELYADRATFQGAFGVVVAADCNESQNRLFTPTRVLTAVATAAALRAANPAATFTLSCANNPAAQAPDYVLTPEDVQAVTAVVNQMNAHITAIASANGWAVLDANAVLGQIKAEQPAFSVYRMMTCALPYGPYISLDGVHPSNSGHVRIANAAIDAINAHYDFALPKLTESLPNYATVCPAPPGAPGVVE